jgi:hypothetical protein
LHELWKPREILYSSGKKDALRGRKARRWIAHA